MLLARAITTLDYSYIEKWNERADFLKHAYPNRLNNQLDIEKIEL